jgi:cytosine deaminase
VLPGALPAGAGIGLIQDVRLLEGSSTDLGINDEIVGAEPGSGLVVDGRGWLALPPFGEPHAHLDKALTADRASGELNGLLEAVAEWQRMLPGIDRADIRDRAARALEQYVTHGVTAIRSHVDLPPGPDPLRGVRALLELRDALAGRLTLQVVPLVSPLAPTATAEAAADLGVDVLGGCPHLAADPRAETTRLLDVAERYGLPLDLHTDERLDLDGLDLADLAEQVLTRGFPHRVTASHCVRLASLPSDRLAKVLALVAEAGINVVVNPQTNLFLQGREVPHSVPRGIAPVRALLDAGITVAAGGDNLRDPFNAVGRGDPLETASLLVTAGHVSPREAFAAVTSGVRQALGLPRAGPGPGAQADLVLVPEQSLSSLVAGPGDARVVLGKGRVLARTRVERSLSLLEER